jgi:hypothetical protein
MSEQRELSSPFTLLPFDVLAILCEYIKFDDVKNMRLVCRTTRDKFNEYFARLYVNVNKLNSRINNSTNSHLFNIIKQFADKFRISYNLDLQLATSFRKINTLSFHSLYNRELPESLLQLVNLETVIFYSTSRFNQSIDILGKLPNLKKLVFGYYFNQSIEPLRTAKKLRSIQFGTEFNQPIEPLQDLKLESLIFGCMSQFSYPITCLSKMKNLKILCFGGYFNQDISPLYNLENLRELKFGMYFNQPIEYISSLINLEKLIFTGEFNNKIDQLSSLTNLRVIRFGTKFSKPIDALAHMENLEEIIINNIKFLYGYKLLKIYDVLPLLKYVTIPIVDDSKHIQIRKFIKNK